MLPGGVEMAFAYCPPGTFLMESPESEEGHDTDELLHPVTLTKGFYAGVHPVTQEQWRAVMGTAPSHYKGDLLPVENVSWDDAQAYCEAVRGHARLPVRLPTEAEWEYAARGGTTTPFYWGNELNGTQANSDGSYPYGKTTQGPYLGKTSPVGNYAAEYPHPWGLTDVIGNVWEWCADWHDYAFYLRSPAVDPECHDGEQEYRVLRGGAWAANAGHPRAAARGWGEVSYRDGGFGFRVVFTA